MKTKLFPFAVLMCLFHFNGIDGHNKDSSLNSHLNNPSVLTVKNVSLCAIVTQFAETDASITSCSSNRKRFGGLNKVYTAILSQGTINLFLKNGTNHFNIFIKMTFISVKSMSSFIPPRVIYNPENIPVGKWIENNLLMAVIGGSAFLLLILLIVLLSRRKSGSEGRAIHEEQPLQTVVDKPEPTPKENLKTMIIPATSSRTMKFIPGGLEVMSGDDKGRTIRISGYPTEDGSTVTIGREPVSGPRDYAHIQLKERTISRKQAEIIYKDGKLYIKNLSETNFTCLDGMEIPVNSAKEINSGSIMTFGEIEMRYNT